ncbi:exotoxin [Salmonella enterica]|nr:exotoxin [Salmonella enterica]
MDRNRQVNKVVHFLLTLLIMFAVSIAPAQALLKGGTWQELNSVTGAVNGTAPLADGAIIPLYQGSTLLDPSKTHDIEFSAMPRDFSADATSTSMRAVNSTDTEGDLFSDPPTIAWENRQPPAMGLVWADAATPDTPLSPQPVPNLTFCAQNLAGRQLVAWAQVEDETNIPALWLFTNTGVPNYATIPLLSPKVTLNIKPAVSDPVSVSGDHVDASFEASKVKVGESITLTVTTKACDGEPAINAPFVIRREDAINRQGVVNNANPVRVGNTELTTAQTEYHGVTDGQGNATVVVTQENGPGVKTRLIVSSQNYPTLTDNVDVIFTTITSPDSDKASMYGHMVESTTATLNGITYTFTRPKLAAEASGADKSVVDTNETWALFDWNGADNHCNILPDAEQLVQMRHEHSTLATYTGWPATDDAEYWSSTKDQMSGYHAAVHMNSASVVRAADSDTLLVSCVDKAQPAAPPQITLSPQGPYKAQVGESIDLTMTVVDRDTQKPLPYRYMELFIDPAKNRKGEHQDAWDNLRVTVDSEGMSASSPEHYTGVTDVNGQAHLTLKHNSGLGVETPIRIVMPDDEGGNVELSFSVIFTVVTSPDVDGANMWGHMRGVVDAGNLYKRPLLYAELSSTDNTASKQETNETWAVFHGPASEGANPARCAAGYYPAVEALDSLYSKYPSRTINTAQGWPVYYSYWSGSNSTSFSSGAKLDFYYAVDLADGSRRSENSATSTAWQYQICATTPLPQATQITLTSPQAMDDAIQAVKAKNSESIPLLITTTDAMGNPVPYATFSLKRDAGKARNTDYNKFVATNGTNMTVTPLTGAQQQFYYATSVLTGATGADGTLALTLAEPGGIGLKNQLTANLNDTPTATSSLPVVFTVLTSPDSDKANMYGHMPETFTASNGAEFKRPLVAGEPSSEAHTDTYFETNENWIMVNSFNTGNYGGCPMNQMAAIDDFTALYNDHPSGKVATDIGLPVGKRWWAGDSLLKGSTLYWQYKDLKTGKNYSMSENPGNYYLQLCLTTSRSGLNIALSSDEWNADKSAAVAKKGETIPMTVTVTNDAGQPQAGVAVLLTRDYAYSRGAVDKQYIEPGVIGEPVPFTTSPANMMLTPVAPAGTAVAFNNQNGLSTKWSGFTGDDGKLRFTLTQDKSLGLKTSVTAALANQFDEAASVDAIFTVQTSPDTPYASYWGHMPDTVQVNGVTLRRPYLKAELSAAPRDTWPFNNEFWGTNYYYQSEHVETSLTHLCGSQENIASLDDLKALQSVIGTLQWPTTSSWDYVSQDEGQSNKYYCSFNETTGQTTCTREKATTSGLGSCRVP